MSRKQLIIFILGIIAGISVVLACLTVSCYIHNNENEILYAERQDVDAKNNEGVIQKSDATNSPKITKELKEPICITIDTTKKIDRISPLLYGSNLCSRMESEKYIKRFVKNIGITIFRFPGGHSGGYHWKIGQYDFYERLNESPLRKVDNIIDFCNETGAQLVLGVNISTGTPQEAAEWVQYMNKERNFKVTYWEIGNEVYGDWDKDYISGKDYAELVKEYAIAMKAVDPTIKIGADWGGAKYDRFDRELLKGAADYIDFVSYHWYPNHVSEGHSWKGKVHPEPLDVIGNTPHIAMAVERLNRLIKEIAPHRKGKIEMTFLEWDGSWDTIASDPPPYEQGRVQWTLTNAIFYADCLGQFAKHGITVSTHYDWQSISFGLIRGWDKNAGWGGQPWDERTVRPKAYAIKIFSDHFGDTLLESTCENIPIYYKEKDWWNGSYSGPVPYVSCYASRFPENGRLGIILINKHPEKDFTVKLDLGEFEPKEEADLWILNGPSLLSQNDGAPGTVKIEKFTMNNVRQQFIYNLPAHSVNAIEIETKETL